MQTVVVAGGKGGVGKSTISYILSQSLSKHGPVLLLDFDLCGPSIGVLTKSHGEKVFKGKKGLKPIKHADNLYFLTISSLVPADAAIIWRAPKKIALLNMFLDSIDESLYKYVVIDMPPGITDEHMFVFKNPVNMFILIVTTSQNLALEEALETIDLFQKQNFHILGVIENMQSICCGNCGERTFIFSRHGGSLLAEKKGVPYLGHIDFISAPDNLTTFPDAIVEAQKRLFMFAE